MIAPRGDIRIYCDNETARIIPLSHGEHLEYKDIGSQIRTLIAERTHQGFRTELLQIRSHIDKSTRKAKRAQMQRLYGADLSRIQRGNEQADRAAEEATSLPDVWVTEDLDWHEEYLVTFRGVTTHPCQIPQAIKLAAKEPACPTTRRLSAHGSFKTMRHKYTW